MGTGDIIIIMDGSGRITKRILLRMLHRFTIMISSSGRRYRVMVMRYILVGLTSRLVVFTSAWAIQVTHTRVILLVVTITVTILMR